MSKYDFTPEDSKEKFREKTREESRRLKRWLEKYATPATLHDYRRYVQVAVVKGGSIQHNYPYPFNTWNENHPGITHRPRFQTWVVIKQPEGDDIRVPDAYGADAVTLLLPEGIVVEIGGHNSAIKHDGERIGFPPLCNFSDS